MNTAIVLAAIVVQLYADPIPSGEMRLSYKADSSEAAIDELDGLADSKL